MILSVCRCLEAKGEHVHLPERDLRDHFAAQALRGLSSDTDWHLGQEKDVAMTAYALADAMLSERAKAKS